MVIYAIMTYMKIKYKCLLNMFFAIFCVEAVLAQSSSSGKSVSQGTKLFEQGKAAEAIAPLEAAVNSGSASPDEYNYLGLSYYQIGNYAKSVETFKKGLIAAGTNKKLLYFNMGNSYFSMGEYQAAIDSFSMAIVADSSYAEPVLNKANAEIKLDKLSEAAADYKRYLVLRPESAQRSEIERLLSLIDAEIAARAEAAVLAEQEAARIKAEEERIAAERAEQERVAAEKRAEEERIAAEKRAEEERLAAEARAAEEERRRKLLEDVANSLRQNSDVTNMSADAEDALDYDYDSDIE